MTGVGSKAILFGGALNNTGIGNQWPVATYTVDGVSGEALDGNAAQPAAYLLSYHSGHPNALLRF